eukprot:scaffold116213_cov31-Tisochrysis_lutea.AAC.3
MWGVGWGDGGRWKAEENQGVTRRSKAQYRSMEACTPTERGRDECMQVFVQVGTFEHCCKVGALGLLEQLCRHVAA